jgi:hypothetical protein
MQIKNIFTESDDDDDDDQVVVQNIRKPMGGELIFM